MPGKNQNNEPVGEEEILDFSNVRPFDPLDSSQIYLVTVSNLEERTAGSGKKMEFAELTIEGPEEVQAEEWAADEDGELKFVGLSDRTVKAKGRKLFRNFVKTPDAMPFLYNFLKAIDPEVKLDEAFRYKRSDYIGRMLAVKGTNSAFNEQVRLQPNQVYPANRYRGE